MSLQNLIDNRQLVLMDNVSDEEVRKRFNAGLKFFKESKKLLAWADFDETFIYKNIFEAARKIAEALLLSNGYRVKGKDHHKTVIEAARLIINDPDLAEIFSRFFKMSKNRNKIEYDILVVSRTITEQAINDTEIFIRRVYQIIKKQDSQKELI